MPEEFEQTQAPQDAPSSGYEVIPTSADTPFSPRDAANALAQYRYKRNAGEERAAAEAEAPAPDLPAEQPTEAPAAAGREAEQATEAAETEAELPAIEPPRSWSKEWKEEFQSYPRDVQEKLAQREQERDAGFRRGQNEAAERVKTKEQQLEQAKKQYEDALAPLKAMLENQSGDFADIKTMADVERLAREDWPRYALWDAHQKKLSLIQQETQAQQQRQQQEYEAARAKLREDYNTKFMEAHPELSKPEVAQKVTNDAISYLKNKGFAEADLNELSKGLDNRWQEIIYDAVRYNQAKAAVPKAVVKPVPKVQRPGTPTERASDRDIELSALNKKLDSGEATWRDGAEMIMALRSGRRR